MEDNMEWIEEEEELIKPTEESKMSWMMKKGWNIGKKVMITGATISSAPIVLPPLLIYSTIGLAFSVPFGFVFGSYACTEKLMSKLLWRPEFEEYQEYLVPEEEEEGYYGEDMNYKMMMDEEERRYIEDTKGTLETRIEFVGEPVKQDSEEVRGDEQMGDSTGGDGESFGEGEILENVYSVGDIEEVEEDLRREQEGGFGGDEIDADKALKDERLVPIEVVEWNMGEIEAEDQPVRGLSGVMEEITEENLGKVLEDEQKMASVTDNGEAEEDNLARERHGDVEESREEGNVDGSVEEEEALPLQNMQGKVREEIEVESPSEMNVENIESVGEEVEVDGQNDFTADIREEDIQYEVLQDNVQKIISGFLDDGGTENLVGGVNEDVEEKRMNVEVAAEEEIPLLDAKEMGGEKIEEDNLSEMSAEECREGLYIGEIGAKGVAEENVDEENLVKDREGDEMPVYEMHPFGGDISTELNFDDVAQEENDIVIVERNRLIGADTVVEEERRDSEENVGSIAAKEEPLMDEKLDDNETVRAVRAAEGIVIKCGDGQNVDEHKEEGLPAEEAEGIRYKEEAPVTGERRLGEIVADGGAVDERKDEGMADSMALGEKRPLRETLETEDAREVSDESGLHLYEKNDICADNYASEVKDVREIADESGLYLPNENGVYDDDYASETKDAREIADESGLLLYDENDVYGDNYDSAAIEAHEDEVLPMGTSYSSFPFNAKLDSQSQTVNGSAVEEQPSDNLRQGIPDSMVHPVPLEVADGGSAEESEGVGIRSGDDENVDAHKEEELPTEGTPGIHSIEEETQMTRAGEDGNIVDEIHDKEVKKPVEEVVGKMEVSSDEQNGDRIVIPESIGVFHARKDEGISGSMALKEKKPKRETEMVAVRSASQDAREVAEESGLHLYDGENLYADKFASATNETHEDEVLPVSTPYYSSASNAILDNQSRIVNGSPVEKQRLSKTLREEIADSVVHPVSPKAADHGSVEEASMKKTTVPSEQVFHSEEKIWEKIGALRKIVGYQAVMQATCVEELKALYVFTGVEPPFAFKDPADLEEINDKLRLLMLIVGVK